MRISRIEGAKVTNECQWTPVSGILPGTNFVSLYAMNLNGTALSDTMSPLHVLLADDDVDDRYFFEIILRAFPNPTQLATVEDGEKLMTYLTENSPRLPDVLFLDVNMPKKNGSECLSEIKSNAKLKNLPVIMYSTSVHEDIADILYKKGAHYYFRKTDVIEIQNILHHVLGLLIENNFARPTREEFVLNMVRV
jgi:CheY-like chemotaxis protein